jgi:uncharacterized secreted protein with C-terminal beta-propeller domain
MKILIGALIILVVVVAITAFLPQQVVISGKEVIVKFSSEEDFKEYLEESQLSQYGFGPFAGATPMAAATVGAPRTMEQAAIAGEAEAPPVPERVSETTVQVKGIDEPDLVKTDGLRIYFSSDETRAIKAFPPEDLSILSEIDETGNLLLHDNMLIVLSSGYYYGSSGYVYGYDISQPSSPDQKFKIELNGSVVGARLYNDKIYLITQDRIDYYRPCPIQPLTINGRPITIRCTDIYHPIRPIPTDVTYTAFILNPETGDVEKSVSFVGMYGSSIVYMSENAIYITYSYYEDMFKIFLSFFKEKCTDIIPSYVIRRLEEVEGYDISSASKLMELIDALEKYLSSLSDEEQMRIQNEFTNRMQKYFEENMRELEKTGIVKISLTGFDISASSNVPGRPLNQFSLDEYNNYLRIATTLTGMGRGTSENDIYVLDGNLNAVGSIQGIGVTERIYSVRFIGDKGYVVTFRQIDPFFVLDLSNPTNPQLKGELKIPGYSSYLHPIEENLILGIGKEGSYVKVSMFDVSNPENPTESDKYTLNEYWSDILNTHHAFLLDKKHEIFFLPGSKGGYVFSYTPSLSLVKTISAFDAKRAIYIEDYLYVIANSKIVVLDENTWEQVSEIELPYERVYPVPIIEEVVR